MTTRPRTLPALIAALLALSVLAMAPAAHAAPATAPAKVKRLSFSMTLKSTSKTEQQLGKHQYGSNILEGTTTIAGARVSVQRISVTDYTDGSGAISGFLTLTWPDGSRIGFSVTGQTQEAGSRSHVFGTLRVIAGTGKWRKFGGIGVMEGLRKGPIGSPVAYDVSITLST